MRLAATLAAAAALALVAGCSETREPGSGASSPELQGYCALAESLGNTDDVDGDSVDSLMASFARSAATSRALAEAAPPQVQEEHQLLAQATEGLLLQVQAGDPATVDDFWAIVGNGLDAITSLRAESNRVEAFAQDECGLD